jgi:dipeptidyl aminopeptidase/acylaminoacyl peptidase
VTRTIAPYGSWRSPVSTQDVFAQSIAIDNLRLDGGSLYWSELRPDGKAAIVRRAPNGAVTDVTPPGYDARTRVHEYGGSAFAVWDGVVYFSNFEDQHLYRLEPGAAPQLFAAQDGMRYADAVLDRRRGRMIVVREDHTTGGAQAVNTLVTIDLAAGGSGEILVAGNDFYASPCVSPDGDTLAWLTWNHPNMPWDGTELWLAKLLPDGSLADRRLLAGGESESVFQPCWSADGDLYFVSDRTGFWNLYRWEPHTGTITALHPMDAEFGMPQWVFGMSSYALAGDNPLICSYLVEGIAHLAVLDVHTLAFQTLDLPYTTIDAVLAAPGEAYLIAASATTVTALLRLDVATGQTEVIRRARDAAPDAGYVSVAQPIAFPTNEGLAAYGFFYPPTNPDFGPPPGELPPLIVMSHGGPTAATSPRLRISIQYWTTRGFAVFDVNYGGSTGYGRAYRERLRGMWGIVDLDDCVNGARYLVAQGLVDGKRLAIRGGSAGGYTTLCALTFTDMFAVGASYYGVSDLEALAKDTHKFESRYLDSIVGPYPECRDIYVARSAIHHTNQLSCPMILLQGEDDPIVPLNQAQTMYEAVRARELPVAMIVFGGEQHGFVRLENNVRALEAELYFYAKILEFEPADPIEAVEIENL